MNHMSDCDDAEGACYDDDEGDDCYEYTAEEEDEEHVMSLPKSDHEPHYLRAYHMSSSSSDGDMYTVLEQRDMGPLMDRLLEQTEAVLGVSADVALKLLSLYGWDTEKLQEEYWTDVNKCLSAAGHSICSTPVDISSVSAVVVNCKICYDNVPQSDLIGLKCGHYFCKNCYSQYLNIKVDSEGPHCLLTLCAEANCTEVVPLCMFNELLSDAQKTKYRNYAIRKFIEASKFLFQCPTENCNRVIVGRGVTKAICLCSNLLCLRCGRESHQPTTCSQLSIWLRELETMNDQGSSTWMVSNTQLCPNCFAPTEKNQGCNHMTCLLCKHPYCWICREPWAKHTGGYTCNKFPGSGGEAEKSGYLVQTRLKHYSTRYQGHHESMKHAQTIQLVAIKAQIKELQTKEHTDSSLLETCCLYQDVIQAVVQVIECRRVLKYTYALGYFLSEHDPQRCLFEHHQKMLESNTDALSELTEQPLSTIDRMHVQKLTQTTDKLFQNLHSEMMEKYKHISTDAAARADEREKLLELLLDSVEELKNPPQLEALDDPSNAAAAGSMEINQQAAESSVPVASSSGPQA